jgi:hypothetical protein
MGVKYISLLSVFNDFKVFNGLTPTANIRMPHAFPGHMGAAIVAAAHHTVAAT